MDRRERFNDLNTALLAAFSGFQSGMWTAMPAIINSFDPDQMTVTAYPTIQGRIQQQDGSFIWADMPLLIHVPVVFQSGGGFTMTFPIAEGDEALIVFASRCIDAWWQSGGINRQAELRMHDLSDGFAFIGPRSIPRVISGISVNSAQLRSDDGETYIDIANGSITINATNVVVNASDSAIINTAQATINADDMITLNAPQSTCTGNLTVEGLFTFSTGSGGDFTSNGISSSTHKHSLSPSGETGEPVP